MMKTFRELTDDLSDRKREKNNSRNPLSAGSGSFSCRETYGILRSIKEKTRYFPGSAYLLCSDNCGAAMVFVVTLAVLMSIMIATLFLLSNTTMRKSSFRRINVAILNIAEAGKEDGISRFRSGAITPSANTLIGVVSDENFGGGSYVVTCSANVALDTMWIFSLARYAGQTKKIEATYRVAVCSPEGEVFEKGICAGGDISWTGSGSLNAGIAAVCCNGFFSMSGSSDITANIFASNGLSKTGSCDIKGNVSALTVTENGSGSITGTVTLGSLTQISIPEIDWTPYYQHAHANGQVYSGDKHITGASALTVPGGIMWVEGNFQKTGSGDFTGCIIASGDVTIAGSGDFVKVNEYPLAVSRTGKIDFSGSGDVRGLLYAQNGNFEKTGSGNVVGSIVCKGDFKKSGSWDLLNYEKSVPVAPGCTGNKFTQISWKECL